MNELIKANIAVLEQVMTFVTCCHDETYKGTLPNAPSSIGKHIRHILDHYQCLERGLPTQLINFNDRSRDSQVEFQRPLALESTNHFIVWLQTLDLDKQAIKVISDTELGRPTNVTIESTAERELLYLINHTVHHLAYAALLAKLHGHSVPDSIGVAPSTFNYQKTA